MFRLCKKALYAVEAVLDIAYHAGAEPVQSLEIGARRAMIDKTIVAILPSFAERYLSTVLF